MNHLKVIIVVAAMCVAAAWADPIPSTEAPAPPPLPEVPAPPTPVDDGAASAPAAAAAPIVAEAVAAIAGDSGVCWTCGSNVDWCGYVGSFNPPTDDTAAQYQQNWNAPGRFCDYCAIQKTTYLNADGSESSSSVYRGCLDYNPPESYTFPATETSLAGKVDSVICPSANKGGQNNCNNS